MFLTLPGKGTISNRGAYEYALFLFLGAAHLKRPLFECVLHILRKQVYDVSRAIALIATF